MEWISVKDRLPIGSVRVLICLEFGDINGKPGQFVDTGHYHYRHKIWLEDDESLMEYHNDVTVTHWMPLPEPPKQTI